MTAQGNISILTYRNLTYVNKRVVYRSLLRPLLIESSWYRTQIANTSYYRYELPQGPRSLRPT